jgi:magnesium chelatase subunit D
VPDIQAQAADAWRAAACLAIDPVGLGGAVLRTDLGETTDLWLATLARLLPEDERLRRLPPHIDDERLLGGTDLAATLRAGKSVHARGLLEECATGILVLPMAERAPPQLAARLGGALDRRAVLLAREGQQREFATRFALVALDGGRAADERCAPRLLERLALHIELGGLRPGDLEVDAGALDASAVAAARGRCDSLVASDDALRALCGTAAACGIDTLRAPLLALRVARAHAALEGNAAIEAGDLEFAARVVLGPRATRVPQPAEAQEPPPPEQQAQEEPRQEPPAEPGQPPEPPAAEDPQRDANAPEPPPTEVGTLEESIQDAARAVIPADLLARLAAVEIARARSGAAGRVGASVLARRRGRPAGVRAGNPGAATRLNIVATLRTAAPWQRIRRQQARPGAPRVQVQTSDFRVTWFRQRTETVTIFAIDASGSSALHRLAEAKGAVELLLADCYVRRDQVAVIAFRGRAAELALAPTRSLPRVKRSLAGLPGGGGTPLASALDAAARLVIQVRQRGQTPTLVLLTDGHANVARDGTGGRARAEQDAQQGARQLRGLGLRALLIDTAPRPQPMAQRLSETMLARYLPLPHADARAMAAAVKHAG